MTRMSKARLLATVVLLAIAPAGACGGGSGSDSSTATGTGTSAGGETETALGKPPVQLDGKVAFKGTEDISTDGAKAAVETELDDRYFKPTFVKAAPGATVTIELHNEGELPHTFTIADLGVDEQVQPGKKATVTVTLPAAGTVRFFCRFHESSGMQGAFYFTEGSTPAS